MTTKNAYKQTEVGLIPEDWECKDLQHYFSFISYGFTNPMPTVSEGVYMITANDVNEGRIKFETARKTTEEAYKYLLSDKSRPKKNDILLTKDGSLGRLALVGDEKICINQSVAVIRPNDKIYPLFLKLLLEDTYYQRTMIDNAGGSTIKHIYITIVNKMQVGIPPTKAEQTTIATALSDADALISSLEKLIAKKRMMKQGAMQKLLMVNCQLSIDNGGWEVKKLGDVCDIRKGQLITESTRINGYIPVIAGGKTPAYYHNKPNRFGKTITISGSGASAGYVSFHNYPIFASDCSTIEESDTYSIEFIFYLMQLFQDKIYKMQTGGAQPHIHPSDLNPILIPIPINQEEQTRIATILSDMDAEISALETKLEKYKKVKLGMMQNLLTGKIRLV